MKIAIGGDHAAYKLKQFIRNYLLKHNCEEIKDFGTDSEESVDYPDFAHPVAEAVERGEYDFGILICGSGNGINMTANKHKGIRAALCWEAEIAALARQHNDANICVLPARFISNEGAEAIIDAFLSEKFEGGRHQRRVEKIAC